MRLCRPYWGKYRKKCQLLAGLVLLVLFNSARATEVFELVIRDHLFYPAELEVPAYRKVKLLVINEDPTPEEFESYELNREKVIMANSRTVIFIGPLAPGEYPFFGEFNMSSARGKVIVRE